VPARNQAQIVASTVRAQLRAARSSNAFAFVLRDAMNYFFS
jgi:hypothetical protein